MILEPVRALGMRLLLCADGCPNTPVKGSNPSVRGQPLPGLKSAVSNTVATVAFFTQPLGLGALRGRPAEHSCLPSISVN